MVIGEGRLSAVAAAATTIQCKRTVSPGCQALSMSDAVQQVNV
jgi:hypothetical protein